MIGDAKEHHGDTAIMRWAGCGYRISEDTFARARAIANRQHYRRVPGVRGRVPNFSHRVPEIPRFLRQNSPKRGAQVGRDVG